MRDQEIITRFIQLRAQNWTCDSISAELKVPKPTLIQWSRQHQFTSQNLRAIETEALAEKCFAGRQQRFEQIGRDLRLVETELAKRDLADVSTGRFLSLAARLRTEAAREVGDLRFSAATRHIPRDEHYEDVRDW